MAGENGQFMSEDFDKELKFVVFTLVSRRVPEDLRRSIIAVMEVVLSTPTRCSDEERIDAMIGAVSEVVKIFEPQSRELIEAFFNSNLLELKPDSRLAQALKESDEAARLALAQRIIAAVVVMTSLKNCPLRVR